MPEIDETTGEVLESADMKENRLIALAINLAEKQLLEGTASAQVITHYLKLGSTRERIEQERLKTENAMLLEKINTMKATQRLDELYANALDAMREYSGG